MIFQVIILFLCYLASHAQVCVYPPTVLSPPWTFRWLCRAHCRMLCLHGHAVSGALLWGSTIRAFITRMTQSTMAYKVALPPLWAESSSSTASQETKSSCRSKMGKAHCFILSFFHLAQPQNWSSRLCYWCKTSTGLTPNVEELPRTQLLKWHNPSATRC